MHECSRFKRVSKGRLVIRHIEEQKKKEESDGIGSIKLTEEEEGGRREAEGEESGNFDSKGLRSSVFISSSHHLLRVEGERMAEGRPPRCQRPSVISTSLPPTHNPPAVTSLGVRSARCSPHLRGAAGNLLPAPSSPPRRPRNNRRKVLCQAKIQFCRLIGQRPQTDEGEEGGSQLGRETEGEMDGGEFAEASVEVLAGVTIRKWTNKH